MSQIKTNPVASVLSITGYIVLILGLIIGLWLGLTLTLPFDIEGMIVHPHPLRWVLGGAVMALSVIAGLMLIGFSENLKLLQKLVDH